MGDKKATIFQDPFLLSAAISGILGALIGTYPLDAGVMKVINVVIPPVSIVLSYVLAWIIAKFYTLSVAEQLALSRLTAREKRIRKDLKAGDMSTETQEILKKELDNIILEKSQIGRTDSVVSESRPND